MNSKQITNTSNIPTLSNKFRMDLKRALTSKLLGEDGWIIFRKVSKVFIANPTYYKVNPDGNRTIINDLTKLSKTDFERYLVTECDSFYGFVSTEQVRDECFHTTKGKSIHFSSNNYSELDFTDHFTFEFGSKRNCTNKTPLVGDMLCMFISKDNFEGYNRKKSFNNNGGTKQLSASKWFIASDQFLKAWTAITCEWHESHSKLIPKNTTPELCNKVLKEKLFCGNRLMTNSCLKSIQAFAANSVPFTQKENEDKFWVQRTEKASCDFVDIYTCLVSIVRYGEFPCGLNVPNNRNGPNNKDDLQRNQWNIPEGLITSLMELVKPALQKDDVLNSEHINSYRDLERIAKEVKLNESKTEDIIQKSEDIAEGSSANDSMAIAATTEDTIQKTKDTTEDTPTKENKPKITVTVTITRKTPQQKLFDMDWNNDEEEL